MVRRRDEQAATPLEGALRLARRRYQRLRKRNKLSIDHPDDNKEQHKARNGRPHPATEDVEHESALAARAHVAHVGDDMDADMSMRRKELHARALDGFPPVADADVAGKVGAAGARGERAGGEVGGEDVVGRAGRDGELVPGRAAEAGCFVQTVVLADGKALEALRRGASVAARGTEGGREGGKEGRGEEGLTLELRLSDVNR